jgi:hypothetical protein
MPDLQMSPVILRLALRAAGAGGLRRDFEFSRRHFPDEKNSNPVALTEKLTHEIQPDSVAA